MCGFSIIIESNKTDNADLYKNIANRTIAYRGLEESSSVKINNQKFNIYIQHERLLTVGNIEQGKQPIKISDKYFALFNGAIYNYQSIRDKYSIDKAIESDTDVLANLIKNNNLRIDEIDGMYALAIIDLNDNKLILHRDPYGEKPLFYYQDNLVTIVSSSLHFIRKVANLNTIEKVVGDNYLSSGPSERSDEKTDFKEIFTVIPSEKVILDFQKQSIQRKNAIENKLLNRRFISNIESQLTDLLLESVEKRTNVKQKYCIGLSGGVDSSTLAGLTRYLYPDKDIYSVSNIYPTIDPSNDESHLIKLVGKKLKIKQFFTEPKLDFVKANIDPMLSIMDFCPMNTCMSGWSTYACMKENGFRYSIEGQGADELFAGYQPYITNLISNSNGIVDLIKLISSIVKNVEGPYVKKIINHGVIGYINNNTKKINALKNTFLPKKVNNKLNSISATLEEILLRDQNNNLRNLLQYGDKSSMYFNVEQRLPYLSLELRNLVNQTLTSELIGKEGTKLILRRIAKKLGVPDEIISRKIKLGWPIPEEIWMKNGLDDYFLSKLNEMNSNYAKEYIRKSTREKIRYYLYKRWLFLHELKEI